MKIHIIRQPATEPQIREMLEHFGRYIKLAVDVDRNLLAGGGQMHADCEEVLLEDGSRQGNIWGADWYPELRTVEFQSFINIRPRDDNYSMEIRSPLLRKRIETIVRRLLEVPVP